MSKYYKQHTSVVAIEERVFSKQLHFYSCESQLAWSQNIYFKLHYKSILRTTLSFVYFNVKGGGTQTKSFGIEGCYLLLDASLDGWWLV